MDFSLKLNYREHFAPREDGRSIVTMAARMARFRDSKAQLALPREPDCAAFAAWQQQVKERLTRQLNLPEFDPQPAPVRLSSVQRDGYRVEKWELYPDKFAVVPFLALIPDGADEQPVPGVLCFPDRGHSKEFCAGEPELDHPNCRCGGDPDTDRMALYVVRHGLAAFVFDNPGDGECSVFSDPAAGVSQEYIREILCHGLLEMGLCFAGVSVYQKLRFLDHLDCFPCVDADRIALCAHGLGTEAAIALALLSERVKGLVFNDILRDEHYIFGASTEHGGAIMEHEIEKWQVVPGKMAAYGYQDLCAALAPRYLGLTEGGADAFVDTVRRGYEVCGACDRLQVNYYPPYDDPAARNLPELPQVGMSRKEFERYSYVDGVKRSFRKDEALALLDRCFGR